MNTNEMNPKVDFYFTKALKWQSELAKLRTIILSCGLIEVLKWGVPCYTFQKSNVVLIHHFKDYCAVLFVKGALLQDSKGVLIQQTENVQAARQVRFTNLEEIAFIESTLKAYIYEAMEVEKSGLKVELKNVEDFKTTEEFQKRLNEFPAFRAAFDALTPGRQRAYKLYFAAPKLAKTRQLRVDNSKQQILDGKGLTD